MKRLLILIACFLFSQTIASAAPGTITKLAERRGADNWAIPYTILADSSTAAFLTLTNTKVYGHLEAFEVVFDGTTPPDSILVTIKTIDGQPVYTQPAAITASTYVALPDRPAIAGGITATFTTNTTNAAIAKVIFYGF